MNDLGVDTQCDKSQALAALLERARAQYASLTAAERGEIHRKQRRSFILAEAEFGDDQDEADYRDALATGNDAGIARLGASGRARRAAAERWLDEHGL